MKLYAKKKNPDHESNTLIIYGKQKGKEIIPVKTIIKSESGISETQTHDNFHQ